jgi:hypothetical protein
MHYISGSYDVRLREEKVLHQQTLHGGTWWVLQFSLTGFCHILKFLAMIALRGDNQSNLAVGVLRKTGASRDA